MGKRYTASITASPAMKVLYFRAVTRNLAATYSLRDIPRSRTDSRSKLPEYCTLCVYITRCVPCLVRGGTLIGMQRSQDGVSFGRHFFIFIFTVSTYGRQGVDESTIAKETRCHRRRGRKNSSSILDSSYHDHESFERRTR